MKLPVATLLVLLCLTRGVSAHSQVEHLKESYKAQGDAFFVPLYWLPETHPTMLRHFPPLESWVDFEHGLWKEIAESDKLKLMEELGLEFDRMESPRLEATWARIRDWQSVSTQLSLLVTFLDSEEGFLDLAYAEPILQPAFKWILDQRAPGFDPKYLGSTLSSGQYPTFRAKLVVHLLNTPDQQRMECFSRLFARIAESKSKTEAQGGGDQPAGRSKSKPEGHDKPQPESEGRPQ